MTHSRMSSSGCIEDEHGVADSRDMVETIPAIRSFFDPNKEANAVGHAVESKMARHAAYNQDWFHYFASPSHDHKLPIPVPRPLVDYRGRVRRETLTVHCPFTAGDVQRGAILRRIAFEQVSRMFLKCTDPRHHHRIALIRVELASFSTSNINHLEKHLFMSMQMRSQVPDPQPGILNGHSAPRDKSWFEPHVFLSTSDTDELQAFPCKLVCNSMLRSSFSASTSLYSENGKTGLRALAFMEGVHTAEAQVLKVPNDDTVVAMKMPVFRGSHNEIDHVVTLHVLEYMKKHNLSPVQMAPQKSTHMILKRVDFEAALMDLNMEVKRRSDCILQDELVFLFEPIHKEDWAPFLKKVPNDKMSLTVDLTLYVVVTGGD